MGPFLLLMLLNEEPMHGYQLAEELQTRGYVREGRFKTGSLYTILNRMDNKEILTPNMRRASQADPGGFTASRRTEGHT